jgi:putative PIN family toxin of toxin-antitoxin system
MSDETAKEVRDVLTRARFNRHSTLEVREEFQQDLMLVVEMAPITDTVRVCRDSKDDKILELAVNERADYIVTGDDDLLVMNPSRGIVIIRPSEFLALVGAEQE